MPRNEQAEEKLLFQYLLGELPEEQQVEIEDRALTDQTFLAEIHAAEADLIDSYVRGELSESERRQFEQMFLASPVRRDKVDFARTLARAADEHVATSVDQSRRVVSPKAPITLMDLIRSWNPGLRFATGLATVACVAGISWLAIQDRDLRSQVGAVQQEKSTAVQQAEDLRRQLDEERARSAKQGTQQGTQFGIASLILLPGVSRAESHTVTLAVDKDAQLARIEIQLDARDEFPRFRTELRTAAGEDVLVRGNLTSRPNPGGRALTLDIPTSALTSGQYELALKGLPSKGSSKDIGFYYFNVQKK
jgi:hypothetical protein